MYSDGSPRPTACSTPRSPDRRADPDLATRCDALSMLVRAADQHGRRMSDLELRIS